MGEAVVTIKISISSSLEEKDAQGCDYEQFTSDAAEKCVQHSKSVTQKDGANAEAEVNLVKETKERQTKMKEALATVNYIEKDGAKVEAEVNLVKETKKKQTKMKEAFAIYGKPETWCEVSHRWRDSRGRFCRPPSPAAASSAAR
jgi:phosphopantothenate synthetase